jgi:predicted amidohydrolase YtcJ
VGQGVAYTNFCEHDRGTLFPGKLADLVMLSEDLFEVPASRIPEVRPELVVVGGAVVVGASTRP